MQIQEGSLVRIHFFNITDSIKKSRLLSASSHATNYVSFADTCLLLIGSLSFIFILFVKYTSKQHQTDN